MRTLSTLMVIITMIMGTGILYAKDNIKTKENTAVNKPFEKPIPTPEPYQTTFVDTLKFPKLSHKCDHTLRSTSLVTPLDVYSPKYKLYEEKTKILYQKLNEMRNRFKKYEIEVRSSIKTATPMRDEIGRLNQLLETRASYKQNKKLWDEYNLVINKIIPHMKIMNIAQKKLVLLKIEAVSLRVDMHMFQAEMGDLRFIEPSNLSEKDIPIILKECDATIEMYKTKLNNYIEGLKKIPVHDGTSESHIDIARQSIDYIKSTGTSASIMSEYVDFIQEVEYRIKSQLFLKAFRKK